MELKIQGPRGFFRDTLANKHWITWTWIVIIAYVFASAAIFHHYEYAEQLVKLHAETRTAKLPYPFSSSLYFTLMNVTTVGFGDITPLTDIGRVIAIVNALAGLVAFGMVVGQLSAGFQPPSPNADQIADAILRRFKVQNIESFENGDLRYKHIRIFIDAVVDHPPQAEDIARSNRS
jgi:hypothetical protein